jgi:hypothetical protein
MADSVRYSVHNDPDGFNLNSNNGFPVCNMQRTKFNNALCGVVIAATLRSLPFSWDHAVYVTV